MNLPPYYRMTAQSLEKICLIRPSLFMGGTLTSIRPLAQNNNTDDAPTVFSDFEIFFGILFNCPQRNIGSYMTATVMRRASASTGARQPPSGDCAS